MCYSKPGESFQAANVTNFLDNWARVDAPEVVRTWLHQGVQIPFFKNPGTFHLPNRPLGFAKSQFIAEELQNLIKSGAIREVTSPPRCISPISCVPKKGGKFRLIVDLRAINNSCVVPRFQYEDINTASEYIQPNDYLISLDIKNGYHHIPVSPEHQQYLGISFQNHYYVWQVLPFGLSASPYFFCKALRPVIQYLRTQGLRVTAYVDDFILAAQKDLIERQKTLLIDTLCELGWVINEQKSSLTPSMCKTFIGYKITTGNKPCLMVPKERLYKLRKDLKRVLAHSQVKARILARITGQCVSMAKAIMPAKLLLRNAYRLLASKITWEDMLQIDSATRSDLEWWMQALFNWNGRPIRTGPIDYQMETDASMTGWGAVFVNQEAAGFWDPHVSSMPSNYRELMAVLMALRSFKFPREIRLQVLTDNVTTAAYINQLGGACVNLSNLAREIWIEAHKKGLSLCAKYLQGSLNISADRLSRLSVHYEWQLNRNLFKYIDRLWGPHTIDRFATGMNNLLPIYNSRFAEPGTCGIDALAQQDWAVHNNYVNPPFRLIPQVLQIISKQKAYATIIAPKWPSQPWYQKLTQMALCPPLRLPISGLTRGEIQMPEACKNHRWRIFAWRICGKQN